MNLKKCHQWLLQKQFKIKKDFVTAIGDIFTHVTAITDPWIGNGCHMSAHSILWARYYKLDFLLMAVKRAVQ